MSAACQVMFQNNDSTVRERINRDDEVSAAAGEANMDPTWIVYSPLGAVPPPIIMEQGK